MTHPHDLMRGHCAEFFIERIKSKGEEIYRWLKSMEETKELPLYSSVDIRDACFKISVVDTNLFPAGFNNLCEHGVTDASKFFRPAILDRVPGCQNILIVAEEHTRNTFYLENIRLLEEIIRNAGFNAKIGTFFHEQPELCQSSNYIELETATEKTVRLFCFKKLFDKIKREEDHYDLIIMNNDLTTGIPDMLSMLRDFRIPIYPPLEAGWHSRSKSQHFTFANELIAEFANVIGLDPWLFSCLMRATGNANVNDEADRQRLMDLASDLFKEIRAKYVQHHIDEKPYIFIKGDAGTYGMSVVPIEDPKDILELNRRARNNLSKGKGAQPVERYLLQEGVPTIYSIDDQVSEICVYQVTNNMIGGFYRANSQKGGRENLNSPGMEFKRMCPHLTKYGKTEIHPDMNTFDVYRILARIAGIAAQREILELEKKAL